MNRTRTIYWVDSELWERARRFCDEHEISISKLLADALRYYLDRLQVTND